MRSKLVREAIFGVFKTGGFVINVALTEEEMAYIHDKVKDYFGVCICGRVGKVL